MIDNKDLINYCISQPYLTYVTKYINKKCCILWFPVNNFILEIRKEIYRLKSNNINVRQEYKKEEKE